MFDNLKVARDFVARIAQRAVGQEVMQSLTPLPAGHKDSA